jgi:hypothetical protein
MAPGLWDELLKFRIKLQGALSAANQLPQVAVWGEFHGAGGDEYHGAVKEGMSSRREIVFSTTFMQIYE